MFSPESQSPAVHARKRKPREEKRPSCEGCRTHKLRCDAYLDYTRGCSRCRKQKLECIVQSYQKKSLSESQYVPDTAFSTSSSATQSSATIALPPDVNLIPVSLTGPRTSTLQRTLDAVGQVNGKIIDACFLQFFQHYLPVIPILSKQLSPNDTFAESPLKFWVIVTIGSKRCLEDPTLLHRLSQPIINLALMSLGSHDAGSSPHVEAMLLLCSWHFPLNRPTLSSIGVRIIGSLFHAALQRGLQNCVHIQGTAAKVDIHGAEEARRAHLWSQVVTNYQIVMVYSGLPVHNQLSPPSCCDKNAECQYSSIGGNLISRASALSARIQLCMSEVSLHEEGLTQDNAIKSLIKASEAPLADIVRELGMSSNYTIMDRLHVATACLQVRTFYLHCSASAFDSLEVVHLYNAAVLVLDETARMDTLYAPIFVFQSIILAASVILKLLKGPKSQSLDLEVGTSSFFSAINLCKRISVEKNDAPAKCATMMSQLWNWDRLYMQPDGGSRWSLQFRTRLCLSVCYDNFYWWRILSGGPQNLSSVLDSAINQTEAPLEAEARLETEPFQAGMGQSLIDDSWFYDVDWFYDVQF